MQKTQSQSPWQDDQVVEHRVVEQAEVEDDADSWGGGGGGGDRHLKAQGQERSS